MRLDMGRKRHNITPLSSHLLILFTAHLYKPILSSYINQFNPDVFLALLSPGFSYFPVHHLPSLLPIECLQKSTHARKSPKSQGLSFAMAKDTFGGPVVHSLLWVEVGELWDVAEGEGIVWPGDKEAQGGPNHALQLPERNYSEMVVCLFPHPVNKGRDERKWHQVALGRFRLDIRNSFSQKEL